MYQIQGYPNLIKVFSKETLLRRLPFRYSRNHCSRLEWEFAAVKRHETMNSLEDVNEIQQHDHLFC